jgi:hypothetical protein
MLFIVASVATAQAPNPDPRVGLKPGVTDAGQAIWNLKLLSATSPSEQFKQGINSDIAFRGSDVIQGNFNGYQIWDISNPSRPTLKLGNFCPASQSDVSTYKNLLFVSSEGTTGRIDCGAQGVKEPISKDRILGIRIFDITDLSSEERRQRSDMPRLAHARWSSIRATETTCTSTSPGPRRFDPRGIARVQCAHGPDVFALLHRGDQVRWRTEQAAVVSAPEIFKDLARDVSSHSGERWPVSTPLVRAGRSSSASSARRRRCRRSSPTGCSTAS